MAKVTTEVTLEIPSTEKTYLANTRPQNQGTFFLVTQKEKKITPKKTKHR